MPTTSLMTYNVSKHIPYFNLNNAVTLSAHKLDNINLYHALNQHLCPKIKLLLKAKTSLNHALIVRESNCKTNMHQLFITASINAIIDWLSDTYVPRVYPTLDT